MRVYSYNINEELPIGECVLALGLFDGVHIAHRDLISTAERAAKSENIPFGIFTFSSESKLKSDSPKLYSTRDKLKLLERYGADFVIVADFDSLCALSPEEFVEAVLIRDIHSKICVAGYNFRFGHKASAGADELLGLMTKNGKSAIIREELKFKDSTVSATKIRSLIQEGRMNEANELLGSPYFISGKVTHGNSKGRVLGFPTANTSFDKAALIPKIGVYRTAVPINGRVYSAVTNIGICPTFSERPIHAETYIIDFDGDVYDDEIEIYLLEYLREEKRFSNEKDLIMQINIDKNITINKNGDITWQALGLK